MNKRLFSKLSGERGTCAPLRYYFLVPCPLIIPGGRWGVRKKRETHRQEATASAERCILYSLIRAKDAAKKSRQYSIQSTVEHIETPFSLSGTGHELFC